MSVGQFINGVKALLKKDITIEFRNKYILGSVLLFSASTVMIVYFSLLYNGSLKDLTPSVWSILFWMVVLFSAINAVSNSFFREAEPHLMSYYFLISPPVYLTSKIIYNVLYTLMLSITGSAIFLIVISNPVTSAFDFFAVMILGSVSYAVLFTVMSAIAIKAKSNNTLVAVLGFPILIPLLIFITKATSAALGAIEQQELFYRNLLMIGALDIMQITLAVILFPYIWRE